MFQIKSFTFNPFQENTYILWDETNECVIVDPGCYTEEERELLSQFIASHNLKPVKLLLTHSHIDHVLGNKYITETYKIGIEMHEADLAGLRQVPTYGATWGIQAEPSPEPVKLLNEKDVVKFGNTELEVYFTPGHSAGSISFFNKKTDDLIVGDVLFYGSIGRTDLPGGNFETLIKSIKDKLYPLGDQVKVYSGHGPVTSIGFEKMNNPFLQE